MWLWGALPLRPPSLEPAGTCRVAWDALPLLPQAILAIYFFDDKGALGAFLASALRSCRLAEDAVRARSAQSGRQAMALVPGPIRASGKADTLARIGPGTSACTAAPERFVGRYDRTHDEAASQARRFARRMQPASDRSELPVGQRRARSR